jgi:hypothetical protein
MWIADGISWTQFVKVRVQVERAVAGSFLRPG